MFIPFLNNYNTRSKMASNIPLCRTIKGQKSTSFLGPKIWNKIRSNIKTAATISSFTHRLKKEILSKLQEGAMLLIFIIIIVVIIIIIIIITIIIIIIVTIIFYA